jgi:hypothetical protein
MNAIAIVNDAIVNKNDTINVKNCRIFDIVKRSKKFNINNIDANMVSKLLLDLYLIWSVKPFRSSQLARFNISSFGEIHDFGD